jgi:hypothetical protein
MKASRLHKLAQLTKGAAVVTIAVGAVACADNQPAINAPPGDPTAKLPVNAPPTPPDPTTTPTSSAASTSTGPLMPPINAQPTPTATGSAQRPPFVNAPPRPMPGNP